MALPSVYDKPHYRGASFDPDARGVPEKKSSIRLEPRTPVKPYNPPAASEDEVLAEAAGMDCTEVRERKQLEDSALRAAWVFKSGQLDKAADDLLRQTGHKLRRQRGGNQLK